MMSEAPGQGTTVDVIVSKKAARVPGSEWDRAVAVGRASASKRVRSAASALSKRRRAARAEADGESIPWVLGREVVGVAWYELRYGDPHVAVAFGDVIDHHIDPLNGDGHRLLAVLAIERSDVEAATRHYDSAIRVDALEAVALPVQRWLALQQGWRDLRSPQEAGVEPVATTPAFDVDAMAAQARILVDRALSANDDETRWAGALALLESADEGTL